MPVSDFQPVIGLEVHAQLLTASKIFCGCATAFGAPPNANTCPVCLGMPGALPVLNRRVVEMAVRTGLALGAKVRPTSTWARKNYFYPDLPKGFQITQYDSPICEGGALAIDSADGGERTIRLRRLHLEEDAGKTIHDAAPGVSLIDLNRAGVPLLEIVSEPDLCSGEEASEYLKSLRDVLVSLGVNDGNLERGSFRCDANVSVRRPGAGGHGSRVEIKNLNSFRFVRQAIEFEIARQVALVESGRAVEQETRLWDPSRAETRLMRTKEEAHDYRYFPEPDLPPLEVSEAMIAAEVAQLPELPRAKASRFRSHYGLAAADAKLFASDRALADFFEACAREHGDARPIANWFRGEVMRLLNDSGASASALPFTPVQFAELLRMVERGDVSLGAAKEIFAEMFRTGSDPQAIGSARGLAQVSDESAIDAAVDEVLAAHPDEVARYRAGRTKLFGFFVGRVMAALGGRGNPALVNDRIRRKLERSAGFEG